MLLRQKFHLTTIFKEKINKFVRHQSSHFSIYCNKYVKRPELLRINKRKEIMPNKNKVAPLSPSVTSLDVNETPPLPRHEHGHGFTRKFKWNPSIWFEIHNVVKFIAFGGAVLDVFCMGFWLWDVVLTVDSTIVVNWDPIQVKMLIIHTFLVVTELLLYLAVRMKSHILAYIWLFFRLIWFYYAIVVWVVGLSVLKLGANQQWNSRSETGIEVIHGIGADKHPYLIFLLWRIAFYTYIPFVLFYCWATLVVAIFTFNTLEEFRRASFGPRCSTVSGMPLHTLRQMSMIVFKQEG